MKMLNDMTKDLGWSYGRRQYHDCWWGGQVVEWDPGPLMRERIVPRKGFLSFPDFSIEITNGRLIWERGVLYRGVWGEGGGVEMRKSERERRAQRKRRKGRRKYTIVSLSSSLVRRSGGKKQLKPPPFHWPLLDCGWRGLITRTRLRLLYIRRILLARKALIFYALCFSARWNTTCLVH